MWVVGLGTMRHGSPARARRVSRDSTRRKQALAGGHRAACGRTLRRLTRLLLAAAVLSHAGQEAAVAALDDFEDLAGWTGSASEGATVEIAQDVGHEGMSLRVDFDFASGAGFVLVRKNVTINLPLNYAFTFELRGEAPKSTLEFKIVDPTGRNVWWHNNRDMTFPREWQTVTVRKSRLEFAWGPAGGGEPKRVGAIELGIVGKGPGKGSLWIDTLRLEPRQAASRYHRTASVLASTSAPEHGPASVFDRKPGTGWRSGAVARNQWLLVDFGERREYGGLVIDWDRQDYATAYEVQVSDDEESWTSAARCVGGNGGRDYIYMPDAESRYVKIQLQESSRDLGYGIAELTVKPSEFSASPNRFLEILAAEAPAGTYPTYLYGRQTYWTVVGVSGGAENALLNEQGMLEVERGGFSIAPFLYTDGHLVTPNDVETVPALESGYLPIPSVTWRHDGFELKITAFADGIAGASTLYARYRVQNRGESHRHMTLFLGIVPFQVNPPWQSLNLAGGAASIREIGFESGIVQVNGGKLVAPVPAPQAFGASGLGHGPPGDFLLENQVPPATEATDPFGFAWGALQYNLDLAPGAQEEVALVIPFQPSQPGAAPEPSTADIAARQEDVARAWEARLGHVAFEMPSRAERVSQTIKSTLAYILINRSGAAIQPGSRSYARSWIRDGALTSAALLEMGLTQEVRDFLRWFAGYQFSNGKIPCCVDGRGADPMPEHDSNGQFVYAIMEYYRYTRDVGFLTEMWPYVVKAVDYIESLRQQRLTDAFRTPDKRAFYGLLPESISHEGYSARPVHSYWDNVFALRGLKDATSMAGAVGDDERAARYSALRDAFGGDLYASISQTMADHRIDYIPGSVELGDFDPSSTAIAVAPGGELANLPQPALTRTFEKYYEDVLGRQDGKVWDSYTPYELRNIEVLVRMGQRERAVALLHTLMADQRPAAWNQWAEIVWRDPAAPRFIGDMPHTWVGSALIRSVRTMFAYERESDGALVVAAGIPAAWLTAGEEIGVKRLPTYYGTLHYTLRNPDDHKLILHLSGDLSLPPGKIVVQPPLPRPLRAVRVSGRPIETFSAGEAVIDAIPATVEMEY